MSNINNQYLKLPGSYLFAQIARQVSEFKDKHPEKALIRMGIGDVTRPLPAPIIRALHKAVDEQATSEGFRGYGPEQGYDFLIKEIITHDFLPRGIQLEPDEVFISDGSKCDLGNFQEILGRDNVVAITDPVYPVYVDSNVMADRAGDLQADGQWSGLVYLPCTAENGFVPELPERRPDIIYLCLPNNPTGTTLNRTELQQWVNYAREQDCLILFDAAYEAFTRENDVPHSIYELEGAREVAVEFRSFSKTAGFTGLRCACTIVPHTVTARKADGLRQALNPLWNRRQTTKYNGCPYIVQRAAAAVYTPEGRIAIHESIDYYMENATLIREGLRKAGLSVYGGMNAPYIWVKTPDGLDSWSFFEVMLHRFGIVGTPGVGFGPSGEGYFRLTAFGSRVNTLAALQRIDQTGF